MTKILYVTDVHGIVKVYERVFELARASDIDAIVFGGDITSGVNPSGQAFFLQFYLTPRLKEFKKQAKKPVFIMMGNDDFEANFKILKKAGKLRTAMLLHRKSYRHKEWTIAGYPYINPTPFLLKDWEKTEEEIYTELKAMSSRLDMEKMIFVFHAPPLGTKLDMLHNGEHKGSEAIRRFIEDAQPMLTLHGHIHESPGVSKSMKQKIGRTLCVNPGNAKIISIDLGTLAIKVIKDEE
ncbi:MAG: metallophosphoesterase [Candidatus Aenigmarchaeota archaeon]|nr:metallophosphoesterase [Candidatus Aenigmarchaeota archaeon]